jgi:hypothetical protein
MGIGLSNLFSSWFKPRTEEVSNNTATKDNPTKTKQNFHETPTSTLDNGLYRKNEGSRFRFLHFTRGKVAPSGAQQSQNKTSSGSPSSTMSGTNLRFFNANQMQPQAQPEVDKRAHKLTTEQSDRLHTLYEKKLGKYKHHKDIDKANLNDTAKREAELQFKKEFGDGFSDKAIKSKLSKISKEVAKSAKDAKQPKPTTIANPTYDFFGQAGYKFDKKYQEHIVPLTFEDVEQQLGTKELDSILKDSGISRGKPLVQPSEAQTGKLQELYNKYYNDMEEGGDREWAMRLAKTDFRTLFPDVSAKAINAKLKEISSEATAASNSEPTGPGHNPVDDYVSRLKAGNAWPAFEASLAEPGTPLPKDLQDLLMNRYEEQLQTRNSYWARENTESEIFDHLSDPAILKVDDFFNEKLGPRADYPPAEQDEKDWADYVYNQMLQKHGGDSAKARSEVEAAWVNGTKNDMETIVDYLDQKLAPRQQSPNAS